MSDQEKAIHTFAAKVHQLILQYQDVKKENDELYGLVDERDQEIKKLKAQLVQSQHDYDSLKMAKMVEISESDMEGAQKRINKLIREVNNYNITGVKLNHFPTFIKAFAMTKKACAMANGELGLISPEISKAIQQACDEVISGKFNDQFVVDMIQGGASHHRRDQAQREAARQEVSL